MDHRTLELIRNEMRLQALENWVIVLTNLVLGAGEKFVPTVRDEFRAAMSQTPVAKPGTVLDPAMSDLSAGELEDAIQRLLARLTNGTD
ncbi:MAG TPA: hypothetical protein VGF92_07385 [Stellaceae bacterium]|jgi:hypothetical protein